MTTHQQKRERVWFITGSSSGFGRALTEAVLARGERVVAGARRLESLRDLAQRYSEQILVVPLDVTKREQIIEAIQRASATFGPVNVLVNCAGYGLMGAIEEAEEEEVHRQFKTNVFGTLAVIQTMLPQMREQRQGHILTISSMTGFAGVPGYGYYSATKFALEGLLEALAQEVAPLGIRVTIVEPGIFHTSFNERSAIKTKGEIGDYAALNQRMQARMARVSDRSIAGDPQRAAQIMITAVEADQPPLHLVLGADALAFIRQKLVSVAQELDAWEYMSRETAFIDAQ